jgi:hypothetical protein
MWSTTVSAAWKMPALGIRQREGYLLQKRLPSLLYTSPEPSIWEPDRKG